MWWRDFLQSSYLTSFPVQILALEAISVKSNPIQIKNALMAHLDRINEIPMFRSSVKIFLPESNYGNEAGHLYHMIRDRSDVRSYCQKEGKYGVWKDKDSGDEYQYAVNVKLKNDAIRFDSEFFTTSPKHTAQSIKGVLREQMERYRFEFKEPKDVHQTGRVKVTGKQGNTVNDDVMTAFAMGVFWPRLILRDPRRLVSN